MVMVEEPEPDAIDDGLKVTVTPEGWPDADKATAELKPPVTDDVIVAAPELPWETLTDAGDAESVKLGGVVDVTVSDTVVVSVNPPPVPWTVIL